MAGRTGARISRGVPPGLRGEVMEIRVNGETRWLDSSVTVSGLVEALGIRLGSVVVERNLRIVPRERMADEMVQDGDSLEIIRLVGGG
jgi:thiamine biosynthesis protein ThiS